MQTSFIYASFLGPLLLLIGLSALISPDRLAKADKEFAKSPALMMLAGMAALVIGLLVVQTHNIWVESWVVLVTVLGWLALVKGILLLVFPGLVERMINGFLKKKTAKAWYLTFGIIAAGLGLYFCHLTYGLVLLYPGI